MHMSYWFGTNIGDFLFQGFSITTTPGFVSTCFILISLAILFEAIKVVLISTRQKDAINLINIQTSNFPNEASSLLVNENQNIQCPSRFIYQLILFLSRDILSYSLMLAVMTYNGYFTMSVSIGAAIGFFVFSPLLMDIRMENNKMKRSHLHCQACTDKIKEMEDKEENGSMLEVAHGVCSVVNNTANITACVSLDESNDDEFNDLNASVAVVQIHSTNEHPRA